MYEIYLQSPEGTWDYVSTYHQKYENTKIDLEDLVSIGTIGLIKGINTFNNEKGVRLATYVSRCIENAHLTLRNYMTYFKRH